MLRRLALAALLSAGGAQAAHLDGQKFSVDYTVQDWGDQPQIVALSGDSVVWQPFATSRSFQAWESSASVASWSGSFSFAAHPSYEINGYTVAFASSGDQGLNFSARYETVLDIHGTFQVDWIPHFCQDLDCIDQNYSPVSMSLDSITITPSLSPAALPVPEPGTWGFLLAGLMTLSTFVRRSPI